MNDRKPLTGNLNFGSDYYATTNKDPISDIHIVNKRYADNLALESGAIKNQIRGINSTVICTPGNADILINDQNKIKIDSDSIDFS